LLAAALTIGLVGLYCTEAKYVEGNLETDQVQRVCPVVCTVASSSLVPI